MKTKKGFLDFDDLWEVQSVEWPRVVIVNVGDRMRNPKTSGYVWDVSLLRKLPTRDPSNAIVHSAFGQ